MPPDSAFETLEPSRHSKILVVVWVYALLAGLWILISDKLVEILFTNPGHIILASMFKGWLFVLVTTLLLYGLMRRWIGGKTNPNPTTIPRFQTSITFSILAIVIISITGISIVNLFDQHKQTQLTQLQAIANLKNQQITDWLKERLDDAEFFRSSDYFAGQMHRWQVLGDLQRIEILQKSLNEFSKRHNYNAITLLNSNGEKQWASQQAPRELAPALQAGIKSAIEKQRILILGPYRDLQDHLRLDIVVPISKSPFPLIVLHINFAERLLPALQNWPIPSASGEALLFRRDGDQILFLNELRFQKNTAAIYHLPVANETLLSAQLLRGEIAYGAAVEGVDYRGVPAIGIAHAIAGTDWLLLAKIDESELYDKVAEQGAWLGFIGLLLLMINYGGLYLFRQHQQLQYADTVRKAQAERLRALMLLGAIADSSEDAIFAKDLDGRFTLFNAAASRIVGKAAEDVLGYDDHAIFPAEQAQQLIETGKQIIASGQTKTYEELLDTVDGQRIFLATKGPLLDEHNNIIGLFGISHDITERKQAEIALLESESGYRSLFENMLNGYAHCQMLYENGKPQDYIYLNVNKAFETLTGLKNVVGCKVSEVIPGFAESSRVLLEIFGKVALGGQPQQFESYVQGISKWFSISVFSVKQEQFVILFDNITERIQTQKALLKSEEFTRAILDSVNAEIAVIDRQGVIIAVNRPWQQFAEENCFTNGELARNCNVGANYLAACQQSNHYVNGNNLNALEGIQAVLEARMESFSLEYPCHSPTQKRWFTMTARPLSSNEGVVIAHIDITQRKLAEENLQKLTDDLSATLQAVPDLLFEIDENGRYINVKATHEDLLTAPRSELLGHTVQEMLPPEAAQTIMESLRVAGESGADYGRTITLPLPGGERCFELSVARKPSIPRYSQHFVVLSRDITDRKAAIESLRVKAQELVESNNELQRFNRAMVGRELIMIELKQEVNYLSHQLGLEPPYPLAFLADNSQANQAEKPS